MDEREISTDQDGDRSQREPADRLRPQATQEQRDALLWRPTPPRSS